MKPRLSSRRHGLSGAIFPVTATAPNLDRIHTQHMTLLNLTWRGAERQDEMQAME